MPQVVKLGRKSEAAKAPPASEHDPAAAVKRRVTMAALLAAILLSSGVIAVNVMPRPDTNASTGPATPDDRDDGAAYGGGRGGETAPRRARAGRYRGVATARALIVRPFLLLALTLLAATPAPAKPAFFLKGGERVLFLGDSNTQAGGYVHYVDAFLSTRFPDRKFELINLGLASETVSGLSEPDHPFPRPDVHERLDRALALVKPDVVVACYGMNDGIYYPPTEERAAAYRQGILKLVDGVRKAKARLVLMTPPPFDPEPMRSKLLPAGAPKYSWMTPYERYDDVLAGYSRWLLGLRKEGVRVVDLHGPISRYLLGRRETDRAYRLAADGVHLSLSGHWLIAYHLLRSWNAPEEVDRAEIDVDRLEVKSGKVTGLSRGVRGCHFEWTTKIPLGRDRRWDRELTGSGMGLEELNRHPLVIRGRGAHGFVVLEGEVPGGRAGPRSPDPRRAAVDLQWGDAELSTLRRGAEVLKLVQERRRILDPAWVSAVGHKRPGIAPGLPLEEAQRKAEALEIRIRELARPIPVRLLLR